jgi:3-dehydrosphinganine reductase
MSNAFLPFDQQHVIITGGSSGIGLATACQLAAAGAHITIVARRPDRLAEAQREIEQARAKPTQRVVSVAADVALCSAAERAVHEAIAQNGPPDIVITSAGMVQPGLFETQPIDAHEQTMRVNYFGTLYVLEAALPAMLARGRGHLVLVSSGAGLYGVYGYSSYSPSKFALHGLAQALRSELKPHGIHVVVVFPPDTHTPQLEQENLTKPAETRRINGAAPPLEADEVARAIVRGIRRRHFAISPGLEMSALAIAGSLMRPLLNVYVDWVVRSVRREREQTVRSQRLEN